MIFAVSALVVRNAAAFEFLRVRRFTTLTQTGSS